MKNSTRSLFFLLVIVSIAFSCKDSGNYQPINSENNSNKKTEMHKVIAKEVQNAGKYTYIKVSENNEEFWIAIPKSDIEIDKTYFYSSGMKMVDFKSKELDKVFEEVWFIDALYNKDPEKLKSEKAQKSIALDPVEIIEQAKNGTSIENLLKHSETFLNKDVVIKGKVVKVNRNILDRNWVHLKDGTTFNSKTEITITTLDTARVGDIVTFMGQVTLGKDFGYGYVYPILIENGKLIK